MRSCLSLGVCEVNSSWGAYWPDLPCLPATEARHCLGHLLPAHYLTSAYLMGMPAEAQEKPVAPISWISLVYPATNLRHTCCCCCCFSQFSRSPKFWHMHFYRPAVLPSVLCPGWLIKGMLVVSRTCSLALHFVNLGIWLWNLRGSRLRAWDCWQLPSFLCLLGYGKNGETIHLSLLGMNERVQIVFRIQVVHLH